MNEKKFKENILRVCRMYDDALTTLKEYGYCDLITNGGSEWNEKVRANLERRFKAKIMLVGHSPKDERGHESTGTYRYSIEIKNNLDAKSLLSDTMD